MDELKIEYEQNTEMPMSLDTTYIRPPGLFSKIITRQDLPINNVEKYENNNSIKFEINTTYFLNPFTLFFTFDLVNDTVCPIQLDGSAHSLIKKIEIKYKNTGKILEVIDDYDILTNLYFDLHLNKKDRRNRRENEGFGDNEFGSNETVIPHKNIVRLSFKDYIKEHFKTELNAVLVDENNEILDSENERELNKIQEDLVNLEYDKDIERFEEWTEVKDGKLRPRKNEAKDDFNNSNIVHFKVPLQLKTIGQAIQPDNFKYIPMAVIGPIIITITLSPDGCFIPLKIKKLNAFKKRPLQNLNPNIQKKFHFEKVRLEYELNQFSPKATEQIFNQVKNGEFIIDHCNLEFLNHFYVLPYPTIDGTSEFKEKKEIKAMHLIFMTDLYQHSPYSRKLARHNKGFKRIQFTYKNKNMPEIPTEHNSYNTCDSDKNCNYFWNQLEKSIETQNSISNDPSLKPILTKANFALNYSLTESVALHHLAQLKSINYNIYEHIDFCDKEWLTKYLLKEKEKLLFNININKLYLNNKMKLNEDFDSYLPDFQNKSIFTFNFDEMKYSYGLYRNGIKVAPNDKFKLSIHRISDYQKYDQFIGFNDVYTYLYIFVEYYESLVLSINGNFISY